jgi:hypothetical protein
VKECPSWLLKDGCCAGYKRGSKRCHCFGLEYRCARLPAGVRCTTRWHMCQCVLQLTHPKHAAPPACAPPNETP